MSKSRGCGSSNSGGSVTSILLHDSAAPCPDECTPLDACPQVAWQYSRYDKNGEITQVAQATRAARKNLGADANQVPPWERRKSEKERKAAKKGAGVGR